MENKVEREGKVYNVRARSPLFKFRSKVRKTFFVCLFTAYFQSSVRLCRRVNHVERCIARIAANNLINDKNVDFRHFGRSICKRCARAYEKQNKKEGAPPLAAKIATYKSRSFSSAAQRNDIEFARQAQHGRAAQRRSLRADRTRFAARASLRLAAQKIGPKNCAHRRAFANCKISNAAAACLVHASERSLTFDRCA